MVEEGQAAPDFALPDGEGNTVWLSDFQGRRVVLYFYPKDLTAGCTQQACDFRDRYAELQAVDVVLLGVSPDDARSHQKFAAKHALPFPLLVDTDHAVAEAYGVWKEKSMYGRTYMGIERSTFLIDEAGKIARIWRKVRVPGHGDQVVAAVKG